MSCYRLISGALLGLIAFGLWPARAADDTPLLQLPDANRLAEPDVLPASDEARNALLQFQLPPGFTATLWAAEPMLANPVALKFDHRGRLFVAETYRYRTSVLDIRDYMESLEDDLDNRTIEDRSEYIRRQFGEAGLRELGIESERVRLLIDRDDDGTADFATIYAEDFDSPLDGIASGVLPWRDGVFLTNIPSLWYLTGEEHAETRAELLRGFGIRFGFTGHDLHGLAWGPDGKLYFSVGDRAAHVPTKDGRVVSSPDTGAVFRCNPDGTELEIVHRGLRNPQDLVFTENGDLFTGDNDSDQGDMERLVQIVEGGDSGWRIGYQFAPLDEAGPWNLERIWTPRHAKQPAHIVPPICNIEDGPSGIAYYPGTGLAPEYAGNFFITHFRGSVARSGVYRYELEPAGATYRAVVSEPFLDHALPTDVEFGPDGRLYISDWAEGWPKSRRGRIYAIDHPDFRNDPLRAETRTLLGAGMGNRSISELSALLSHADQRVRLAAQFALADRGTESATTLAAVAANTDAAPLARLHAVWGLGQVAAQSGTALDAIRPLLTDADAEVRAQAARVLGDHRDGSAATQLVERLQDENSRVKFFAAQGLGRIGRPESAAPLIEALRANDDHDPYLRHALVMGLVGSTNVPAVKAAITDDSEAVRLGALLVLRRWGDAEAARLLADPNPFIVAEAARAINDEPIVAAYPALAAFIGTPRNDHTFMLRALNAAFRIGTAKQAAALGQYAARDDQPAELRAEALAQLLNWPTPPARDRIVGIFRPLPAATRDPAPAALALKNVLPELLARQTPEDVLRVAMEGVRKFALRDLADTLFATVADNQRAGHARATALEALDYFDDPRLAEAVAIAGESSSPELQAAAVPVAAKLSPDTMIPVLAGLAATGDYADQRMAYTALAGLELPQADDVLAANIRLLGAGGVDPAAAVELLEAAGQRDTPEINRLLANREAALQASGDPIAPFRFALEGGSPRAGRLVFNNHPVFACQRCHVIRGEGGQVGPDLSLVGTRLTREQLLTSVIAPNAAIADGFETVVVTLKTGEVYAGTVAGESPDTLVLRQVDNTTTEIAKAAIARRDGAPSSMPDIYSTSLTKHQLRDLIAFLAGLDSPPRNTTPTPRALTTVRSVSTEPETDLLEK